MTQQSPNPANPSEVLSGIDSTTIIVACVTVIIVVVVAWGINGIIGKLLTNDAKPVDRRTELVWLGMTAIAVVATVALMIFGGVLGIISQELMGTLLTILITAIGVKLFDGITHKQSHKDK